MSGKACQENNAIHEVPGGKFTEQQFYCMSVLLSLSIGMPVLSHSLTVLPTSVLHQREIFAMLVAWVVQKVYNKTGPFSHIFAVFLGLSADI